MPNDSASLLRSVYSAFNARDIDAAQALMTLDVEWPRAFKGGYVHGYDAVRAYWTEQWGEIDPHVEPVALHMESPDQVLVDVRQVIKGLDGKLMSDGIVHHRFTIVDGLIRKMDVVAGSS